MKTIGLLGGMSWESSLEYYRLINEGVKAQCGGLHSANCVLYSVDFAEIEQLQQAGEWAEAAAVLTAAAQKLEKAGADFWILCTNTMHKVADEIQSQMNIPFLHIADATAAQIQAAGLKRIGLLGTRYTMEQNFYKGRLIEQFGLEVLVPEPDGRDMVHHVIYEELCLGVIQESSRQQYQTIIQQLVAAGAEGIILGCTEIELLIQQPHSPVPLFPTTSIHAQAAVAYALQK